MHKVKTIIFIDWDDTLFPTSYYKSNLIDNKKLSSLDDILSTFLQKYQKNNNIFIISNASAEWLKKSILLLPKTNDIVKMLKIPIISARDTFIDKCELSQCKEKTFQEIVKKYDIFNNYNIISIGDAHYEYVGLLKMNDYINNLNKKCLLKNIKFMANPSNDEVYDQLEVLTEILKNIIIHPKFVDIQLHKN
jgi:hypothetical protein